MSGLLQCTHRRRRRRSRHALRRPASEKRRGTKSRRGDGAAIGYGDLFAGPDFWRSASASRLEQRCNLNVPARHRIRGRMRWCVPALQGDRYRHRDGAYAGVGDPVAEAPRSKSGFLHGPSRDGVRAHDSRSGGSERKPGYIEGPERGHRISLRLGSAKLSVSEKALV